MSALISIRSFDLSLCAEFLTAMLLRHWEIQTVAELGMNIGTE